MTKVFGMKDIGTASTIDILSMEKGMLVAHSFILTTITPTNKIGWC